MPPRLSANQIARRALAGIAVGQMLAIVIDRTIGGPGAFALFGL